MLLTRFTWLGVCTRRGAGQRKGVIIVLTAFLLIVLMAMLAFSIDVGYMSVGGRRSKRRPTPRPWREPANWSTARPPPRPRPWPIWGRTRSAIRRMTASNATVRVRQLEHHHQDVHRQQQLAQRHSRDDHQPVAAAVLRQGVRADRASTTPAKAIAIYQPRDIALVLDYSGSMCYDSQFRNIYLLGQTAIEANLKQIYQRARLAELRQA